MTYKLNTLGRETIRNFIKNNAFTNRCSHEFFEEAERMANTQIWPVEDGVWAVELMPPETIHRYQVVLILKTEHYDNVPDDAKTTHKTP